MSWEEIKVKDLGDIITGNTPPKKKTELYGDAYKFIKASDMTEGQRYTFETEERYSHAGYKKYSKSLIPPLSTCVVTIGTLGRKMTLTDEYCFVNQAINAVIPNDKHDPFFVYYALKNIQHKVKFADTGASSGRENISKSTFSNLTLLVPSNKSIQAKIGGILSAYDGLIENNLKRIRLLEEAAQNIYREWFVHFRFPGYEQAAFGEDGVPVGWEMKPFESFIEHHIGGGWGKEDVEGDFVQPAYVIRGTDIPKLEVGSKESVPHRFHKVSNLKSRKLIANDLVFEVSGGSKTQPVGRSILITEKILELFNGQDAMCASFCKLIRVNANIVSPYYISSYVTEIYSNGVLAQYENQSASNIINFKFNDFISREKVVIPSNQVQIAFENLIRPIRNQIGNLGIQNNLLKEGRDILLPRLMNRTIEV